MHESLPIPTLKRLAAATGYLELGLPQQALDSLRKLPDTGPHQASAEFLRGVALRAMERYEDAVPPLTNAASMVPPEIARHVWFALSQCYRETGRTEQAIESLAHARGANLPSNPSA